MSKTQTILDWLNTRFKYKSDNRVDSWRIMDLEGEMLSGDCDDYATTLMYLLSDESKSKMLWNLTTLKFVPWFCKLPNGQFHVALWVRGEGWVDNVQKKFTKNRPNYTWYFPYPMPVSLLKIGLGSLLRG